MVRGRKEGAWSGGDGGDNGEEGVAARGAASRHCAQGVQVTRRHLLLVAARNAHDHNSRHEWLPRNCTALTRRAMTSKDSRSASASAGPIPAHSNPRTTFPFTLSVLSLIPINPRRPTTPAQHGWCSGKAHLLENRPILRGDLGPGLAHAHLDEGVLPYAHCE